MTDFNTPYAKWLEEAVKAIFEGNPNSISLCAIMPDGNVLTAYYNCSVHDKAIIAHNINADAMLDNVVINIDMIKDALDGD